MYLSYSSTHEVKLLSNSHGSGYTVVAGSTDYSFSCRVCHDIEADSDSHRSGCTALAG